MTVLLQECSISITAAGAFLLCVTFLTCSAVVSLGELDLDLVLPGDVLDAATFGPHDGTVVALGNGHLHAHLGLLLEGGDSWVTTAPAANTHHEFSRITSGC